MNGVLYEFSTLTHLNLSFPFVFLSSRFFGLSFKVIFLCVKSASNSDRLVYLQLITASIYRMFYEPVW